jgi:hypothetical protein
MSPTLKPLLKNKMICLNGLINQTLIISLLNSQQKLMKIIWVYSTIKVIASMMKKREKKDLKV